MEKASTEAELRTVVSRAYYAAYNKAVQVYVDQRGEDDLGLGGEKSHQVLWNRYLRAKRRDAQQIGESGRTLKEARVDADYENPFPGDLRSSAEAALIQAASIINRLSRVKIT